MLGNLIYSEWIKIIKANVIPLIWISPLLATIAGYNTFYDFGTNQWLDPLLQMILLHAVLFLPLLVGIFSASICRYEHQHGGWKQLLAMPVTRTNVYLSKYIVVVFLMAFTQFLFVAGLLLIGLFKGFTDPFPWQIVMTKALLGWVACLPLAALQLWFSIAWSSFAAPIAISVIFTLPNILVANSETYGPWYPWVQPFLGMILGDDGNFVFSLETLVFVICGSFVLFMLGGMAYFRHKAV
jgi:hypothetical protein